METAAFFPFGASVTLAVTTTTGSVALTAPGNRGSRFQVRVVNYGTNKAFINFGTSGVTATTAAGHVILANSAEVFTVPGDTTHIAAITAATESATLGVSSGFGV